MPNKERDIIKTVFEKNNLVVDDVALDKFLLYYELLVEWNQKLNLTTITDIQEVAEKHFADSLLIQKTKWLSENAKCIDIGTGAGFPGVVLKIVYPNLSMTLLDSLKKRLNFLEILVKELEIDSNIKFVHARAEDGAHDPLYREKFDVGLSRAVAQAPALLEYTLPYVHQEGVVIAYKGPNAQNEFNTAKNALDKLGANQNIQSWQEITDWGERTLVKIEKNKITPKQYPRKAGMPTKNPL